MKAIIYKNIFEIQEANHQEALNRGCSGGTKYWYPMQELTEETELPKDEYTEKSPIPKTILDKEGNEIENPKYKELPLKVKVKKYAMVVDDDKDEVDDNGNVTVPSYVEDVSDRLPKKESI